MKETSFIEQNKEKWSRFERVYSSKVNEPEELSDLYMDITDDLSYAQTFYKRRTVRVYLNQLAQMVYTGVHKQKGESFKKFFTVWQKSLPLEIYRCRKHLLFALIAFLIYAGIGVLTTELDHDFPRIVLDNDYVEMTLDNIKHGHPLKVYESEDQMDMFIHITTNNLKVAFLTFFVGFFFTFGTHMLMFYNGVMLGAFQYFFYIKGVLLTSFLGIWIHGAFEISAIVLAAGAGITAGNGWLFPKSYTRLQSLQLSTKRGLKIMMSLVPFIVMAGFLESFVTANYQELPGWSKLTLILLSFGIILFFYVFYPMYIARKYPGEIDIEEVGFFPEKKTFVYDKIRNLGELITDSFQFFRVHFSKFSKVIFTLIFPLVIAVVALQDMNHYEEMKSEHWFDWLSQFEYMMGYGFTNFQDGITVFSWTIILTLLFGAVFWTIQTMEESFSWKSYFNFVKKRFVILWLGNLMLYATFFFLREFFLGLSVLVIPFYFLLGSTLIFDNDSIGKRIKKAFNFGKSQYGNTLVILILIILFITLIAQPIAFVYSNHTAFSDEPMVRDLLDMLADFSKRIAVHYSDVPVFWSNIIRQIVYLIFFLCLFPLFIIPSAFIYFSELEKTEVRGLRKQFGKFGKRSRFKETEIDFE